MNRSQKRGVLPVTTLFLRGKNLLWKMIWKMNDEKH